MNTVQQLNKLFIIRIIVFVILLTITSLTFLQGQDFGSEKQRQAYDDAVLNEDS